jgi:hypothetical protein
MMEMIAAYLQQTPLVAGRKHGKTGITCAHK